MGYVYIYTYYIYIRILSHMYIYIYIHILRYTLNGYDARYTVIKLGAWKSPDEIRRGIYEIPNLKKVRVSKGWENHQFPGYYGI